MMTSTNYFMDYLICSKLNCIQLQYIKDYLGAVLWANVLSATWLQLWRLNCVISAVTPTPPPKKISTKQKH